MTTAPASSKDLQLPSTWHSLDFGKGRRAITFVGWGTTERPRERERERQQANRRRLPHPGASDGPRATAPRRGGGRSDLPRAP